MTSRCLVYGLHAIINSCLAVGVPFPIDEAPTPVSSRNGSPISIHGTNSAITLTGIVKGDYISGGTSLKDDILTIQCGDCQMVNQVPIKKDICFMVFRGLLWASLPTFVSPTFVHAICYY